MPAVAPHFRRKLGTPKYPGLWEGCVWAACPSLMGHNGSSLYDLSGRNNHGLLTGFTLSSAYAVRGDGVALALGGSQYVQATSVLSAPPVSLCAWVSHSSVGANRRIITLAQSANSNTHAASVYLGAASAFAVQSYNGVASIAPESSVVPVVNQWYHVCGVFGPSEISLYVGGIQVVVMGSAANFSLVTEVQIGAIEFPTAIQLMTGHVDDMRVYNRELTAREIQVLARGRGIAYETRRPLYVNELTTNLLDARRRAVVC